MSDSATDHRAKDALFWWLHVLLVALLASAGFGIGISLLSNDAKGLAGPWILYAFWSPQSFAVSIIGGLVYSGWLLFPSTIIGVRSAERTYGKGFLSRLMGRPAVALSLTVGVLLLGTTLGLFVTGVLGLRMPG